MHVGFILLWSEIPSQHMQQNLPSDIGIELASLHLPVQGQSLQLLLPIVRGSPR